MLTFSDWTRETLTRLMALEGNSIPNSAGAADLLWRIIQSFSSFPFASDQSSETLSWDSYLHAYALARSSRLVPHDPDYFLDPPGTRIQRNFRKRTSEDSHRFIFQALASPGYDSSAEKPGGERSIDDDVDLRDVMAACMDTDMDKYAWRADDFTPAIRQLPSSNSRRPLDPTIRLEDFELLWKLATSIRSVTNGGGPPEEPLNSNKLAEDPLIQAGDGRVPIFRSDSISWPEFSEAVANHMVSERERSFVSLS